MYVPSRWTCQWMLGQRVRDWEVFASGCCFGLPARWERRWLTEDFSCAGAGPLASCYEAEEEGRGDGAEGED